MPLLTDNDTFTFNNHAATFTNKTFNLGSNTFVTTFAQLNTAVSDATLVSTSSSQTLSGKEIASGTFSGTSSFTGAISGTIDDDDDYVGITLVNNDTTNNPNTVILQDNTSSSTLYLIKGGNGTSFEILDVVSTDPEVALIDASSLTTGKALSVAASALTTGHIARFYSNSSSTGTRNLVEIINDHSSANKVTNLKLQNDGASGTGKALDISGAAVGICKNSKITNYSPRS